MDVARMPFLGSAQDLNQLCNHRYLTFRDTLQGDWIELGILGTQPDHLVTPAPFAVGFLLALVAFHRVAAAGFRVVNGPVLDQDDPALTASADRGAEKAPGAVGDPVSYTHLRAHE